MTAVAMNMMASYPLVQALLVLKPLPTSSRQPCLSRQRSAHLAASGMVMCIYYCDDGLMAYTFAALGRKGSDIVLANAPVASLVLSCISC